MNLGIAQIIQGNALNLPLPDSSVDLICTSPPYWALRSYQDSGVHYDGQLGSEATPQDFLDALIAATREMIRVLKPTGSIFINLGDKYADKGLMGLPWRYAIACIDELGLILRAEIIWSKPNGLPEPVTDRVRRSHEQWFHFTKQPRYFSAVDEIREEHEAPPARNTRPTPNKGMLQNGVVGGRAGGYTSAGWVPGQPNPLGKLPGSVWSIPTQPLIVPPELGVDHFAAYPMAWPRRIIQAWCPPNGVVADVFGGTGTTALVAKALGRTGITIDLSQDYCRLAQWRCNDPRELAAALQVEKPEPVHPDQLDLFSGIE